MQIHSFAVPGPLVIEPRLFRDERGLFFESFNARRFLDAVGQSFDFVQDNHSLSRRGVLRGLHYQLPPAAQAKLIRVVRGEVFDIAVDIRRSSSTFGKWVGAHLSAANHRQLWIPQGWAHGFLTISDEAEVLYKSSDFYAPDLERSIAWNDPQVGIDWPLDGTDPLLSPKDEIAPALAQAELFQ